MFMSRQTILGPLIGKNDVEKGGGGNLNKKTRTRGTRREGGSNPVGRRVVKKLVAGTTV